MKAILFIPFTKNAKGIIMYTPDGYMSAQLGTMNVPKFSGDNLLDGKDDELINGMRNYLAYSGFYKIEQDGDHFNLRHQMDVANYPNWLGDEQKRLVKLTDNKLTLSTETPIMFNGVLLHCYLDWEKLPQID
ncbi:unnamed protein product [Debaryomyces tyrocola]|nr:unnamed protein product [Debaryomyces tyrocola]